MTDQTDKIQFQVNYILSVRLNYENQNQEMLANLLIHS